MFQSRVENPRTQAPAMVPERLADMSRPDLRYWCRRPSCCASATVARDLARHYREYHPEWELRDQPYDRSSYANSRHAASNPAAPNFAAAVVAQGAQDNETDEEETEDKEMEENEEDEEAELEETAAGDEVSDSDLSQGAREEATQGEAEAEAIEEESVDSDEEVDAVMDAVETFGQSGPPFPADGRPSLARTRATRQQRVVRSTVGYLSGRTRR